jgi:hypothetical protein
MKYNNKTGIVTAITEDETLFVDGEPIPIDSSKSQKIFGVSRVEIGDEIEYNVNSFTGDLIFMRVKNRHGRSEVGNAFFDPEDTRDGRFVSFPPGSRVILPGGRGEMANLTLMSHDPYDEWADGDTM